MECLLSAKVEMAIRTLRNSMSAKECHLKSRMARAGMRSGKGLSKVGYDMIGVPF